MQIVCSMNPPSTLGRHQLSTRFTSVIRQYYLPNTDTEQLQIVYRALLQPIIQICLPSNPFWIIPKNIQKLVATLCKIYDDTKAAFTVDMHQHYIFTPRDLSRLITSLSRYEYKSDEPHELLNVVANEATRIFQDRLVGPESKKRFQGFLTTALSTDWNHNPKLDEIFYSTTTFSPQLRSGTRILSATTAETYSEIIAKEVKIYERDVKEISLTLFNEVLLRISRMERVLGKSGGSLLLAGRPGIGRKSAVEIVCNMLQIKVVSPNVGRNYTMKLFYAELKTILLAVGVNGEEMALVMEDYQLVDPMILESLNSILSGGEVPGLYAPDELDTLLSSLKNEHSEQGVRCSLFEFFISRIQTNLHVVLILDSADPKFVSRCESNPALYTRCHVEWTTSWSIESMQAIAMKAMSADAMLRDIPDREELIKYLLGIHNHMAGAYAASPKHLLGYISAYKSVFKTQQTFQKNKLNYLAGGLNKLTEASKFVDKLSIDAKSQSIELAEKQKMADVALKQITTSMMNASDQKREMETLNVQLLEEEEKTVSRKIVIERELKEVEPIVKSALAAVGDIKSESLAEIRSLRAPPPAVRDVLEGVLRLMGNLDMSWSTMKGFLGKRTVKDEILNFDARNITKAIRDSVQELLTQKAVSFEDAVIRRASMAAAPLAMWVKANLMYSSVLEKIGPLEVDLARLTKSLNVSKARVAKLKEGLDVVDQTVAKLRDDFGGKTRDAEILKANVEKAMETITSASGLLEKLSGEGSRWNAQTKSIQESLKALPRNALLAAAFITYLGGASEDVRKRVCQEWSKMVGLASFNFMKIMSTESDQLTWKHQGLPSDVLSMENALVILNCNTVPLIVDPTGQATTWLKNHFSEQKFELVKPHDSNFLRTVELAVRFGKTLLVQEVTDIESSLYPLLKKEFIKQGIKRSRLTIPIGPRYFVQIGDKQVDYNEGFKIYLISKQSSFSIPSNASGLVNEVNFTITKAGLAGQLLGVTIKHEKPVLEVKKIKMLKNEDDLKLQLAKLEESLLNELANSEGNILENKSLIDSLNETKVKSVSIAKSLTESRKLQLSLDGERDKFLPLSTFGSSLYFVLSDMHKLNNMYEFSLSSFLRLFEQALDCQDSAKNDATDLRIKLLKSVLEKLTFKWISRSLFKEDRTMFAIYLIKNLHGNIFKENEWELFTGQIVMSDDSESVPDVPSWVQSDHASKYHQLISHTRDLVKAANFGDSTFWTPWMKNPSCELKFPALSTSLTLFQKVLIVQAFRPDRLLSSGMRINI